MLERIDLAAAPSTLTCVTGASGSGKSTLLYCLAGVLPATGRIQLMGHDLTDSPAHRAQLRLAHCGFIFQRGELLPELTVLENVALPLRLTGTRRREAVAASRGWLEQLGIEDCGDRTPAEISGGQAQRASVARALIHRPSVVLADEPTASLDAVSRDRVLRALRVAVARGAAVVCASHDPTLISAADVIVDLGRGTHADAVTP